MSNQRDSSFTPRWKYDVFLSFRGEDTRQNFTDFLYNTLKQEGINTYRDINDLEKGEPITIELLQAIEQSRFSIVVFSKNYASSTWCLNELVKIVECMNEGKHKMFPVFYDVKPDDVKNQEGPYETDFINHERENKEKVQNWRYAMGMVPDIGGWGDVEKRSHFEVIQDIVKKIWNELPTSTSLNHEDLVGINSRKEELMKLIQVESNDILMIGIWGMGGIGKTTIAKVIYETKSDKFEFKKSFLADVRENFKKDGGVSLQKQLINDILKKTDVQVPNSDEGIRLIKTRLSSQKVLIIIDDVDDIKQLEALAGEHNWFGPGSRIIITTKNKRLLKIHPVNVVYEVKQLNDDDSIQLFSSEAFKKGKHLEDGELFKRCVKYAGGVPLALKVLGSFLCDRPVDEWKSALERFNKEPKKDIFNILQTSFDSLEKSEQKIFLDIACFFKGEVKDDVNKFWEACNFSPTIGISILIEKCLIEIRYDRLWIHDLLQEMGQQMIKKEEFGKRSRLWEVTEICDVLTKKKGIKAVEGIRLDMSKIIEIDLNPDAFAKIRNLRFFDFCCTNTPLRFYRYWYDHCSCNEEKSKKVLASQPLDFASQPLAYFRWHRYPLKALPSRFNPVNLVALVMPHSEVEELWDGIEDLGKLKFIDLGHSKHLTKIPDLSLARNLEILILEGCTSLIKIHLPDDPSRLVELTLHNCSKLKDLPSSFCKLKCVDLLKLYGCSSLERLPDDLGKLEDLVEIDAEGTAIREVPASISSLECLRCLSFADCKNLELNSVFNILSKLSSLVLLKLIGCQITELPDSLGQLYSLKDLHLDKNNFERIPATIKDLSNLRFLCLNDCKKLQSLPELPGGLDNPLSHEKFVRVDMYNCVGLEDLSDISFLFAPLSGYYIDPSYRRQLNLANCFKVNVNALGNKVKDCLLRIQPSASDQTVKGSICYPGNEIPEWFPNQKEGSSITIDVTSDWKNKNFLGIAMCAVVEFSDVPEIENLNVICICNTSCLSSNVWNSYFDSDFDDEEDECCQIASDIRQDHVFLGFSDYDGCQIEEDDDDDKSYFEEVDSNKLYFQFQYYYSDYYVWTPKVKKCGVHLVYGQDSGKAMEEKEEEISKCEKNFIIIGDVTEEQEEPQFKRMKILNFFEGESSSRMEDK